MKKKLALLTAAALILSLTVSCSSQQAAQSGASSSSGAAGSSSSTGESSNGEYEWTTDYTWKLTHEGTQGLGEDHFATTFTQLVNERSDGHITIDIYDFNQLGAGADQSELIQGGAVEFGIVSSGAISALVPEAGIFGLHYIYPAEFSEMWDFLETSETVATLSEIMDNKGFHVFSWNIEGPHVWSMKKPITCVADMKGLKFRTQANQLEMASFEAYGASPTTVAFAELYSALQLGTVDGQQQTGLANNVMNYYDVAPYYIEAHASYYVDAPVCNTSFFESLDPYIQNLLTECALDARASLEEFINEQEGGEARRVAEEHGVTWIEFDETQQAEFAEASVSARDTFLEIGGDRAQEILDGMLSELNVA